MQSLIFQVLIPFLLSLIIVIVITVIAEKFGTKVGGILGTLPSTIIIAFVFIAYTKGTDFASQAVAVVPAELGINLIFLFVFAVVISRSTICAFGASFLAWSVLSTILFLVDLSNILVSVLIYLICLCCTFVILEYRMQIPSAEKVHIPYTVQKILFRGVIAGAIIALSVYLANFGAVLSGIFSVFPAILSSTMLISVREHGPAFASGMAKSMIFGISSVCVYAVLIHYLYPSIGIIYGSISAFIVAFMLTIVLFCLRSKLR